jgi:hypothetical protein
LLGLGWSGQVTLEYTILRCFLRLHRLDEHLMSGRVGPFQARFDDLNLWRRRVFSGAREADPVPQPLAAQRNSTL